MKDPRTGGLVAGGLLAVAGATLLASAFVGPAAWVVAVSLGLGVLVLTTLPAVVRACPRALTPRSLTSGFDVWVLPDTPIPPPQLRTTPAPTARVFTDERLRGAWRSSFRDLQARPPGAVALAMVEERQRYLDEFERRHPLGFATWLASEARASDIPARYLRDGDAVHAEINWDELTRQRDS